MARYVDMDLVEAEVARIWLMSPKVARMMLNGVPTADVQEVRHGSWEEVASAFMDMTIVVYQCSECGATSLPRHKFCPNCGAIMGE